MLAWLAANSAVPGAVTTFGTASEALAALVAAVRIDGRTLFNSDQWGGVRRRLLTGQPKRTSTLLQRGLDVVSAAVRSSGGSSGGGNVSDPAAAGRDPSQDGADVAAAEAAMQALLQVGNSHSKADACAA